MAEGMQISRHWRLNAQRYRLEGQRRSNGEVSLTGAGWIASPLIVELATNKSLVISETPTSDEEAAA